MLSLPGNKKCFRIQLSLQKLTHIFDILSLFLFSFGQLFCPNCIDNYAPPSSRFHGVDGEFPIADRRTSDLLKFRIVVKISETSETILLLFLVFRSLFRNDFPTSTLPMLSRSSPFPNCSSRILLLFSQSPTSFLFQSRFQGR